MEFVIRKIRVEELCELVEMCESHAVYEQAAYLSSGKEEALKELIFSESKKLHCCVIAVADELAGYFSYTFDYSTWDAQPFLHLDCLYLKPPYRGMKIGDRVIDQLVAIAQEHRCVNIQWQTPVFNKRAIRFYNRMGARGKAKIRFFLEPLRHSTDIC